MCVGFECCVPVPGFTVHVFVGEFSDASFILEVVSKHGCFTLSTVAIIVLPSRYTQEAKFIAAHGNVCG